MAKPLPHCGRAGGPAPGGVLMSKHAGLIFVLVAGLIFCDRGSAQQGPDAPAPKAKKALGPPPAMGAGTVNLQKILGVLGLSQQLEERRQSLEKQILAVQKEKQEAFDKKRKEFGDKPTEEQTKELQRM